MYNLNYVFVEIHVDKDMRDQLIYDLENWSEHLYPANDAVYRGLISIREFKNIETLIAMSPYGNGYDVVVDGIPYRDYGTYPWKVVRGIA